VKAKKEVFSYCTASSPAQPRPVLGAGELSPSRPLDGPAQGFACVRFWEPNAAKRPLQLQGFPNLQQKAAGLTKQQSELKTTMKYNAKCSSVASVRCCAAIVITAFVEVDLGSC